MDSLNFNEGYKELAINGDENRILRFNPLDPTLISKLDRLEKETNKILNDEDIEILDAEKRVVEEFEIVFGKDSSKIVFGETSPIAVVKERYLYMVFLEDALIPYITKEMKESEKRMKKYLEDSKW